MLTFILKNLNKKIKFWWNWSFYSWSAPEIFPEFKLVRKGVKIKMNTIFDKNGLSELSSVFWIDFIRANASASETTRVSLSSS